MKKKRTYVIDTSSQALTNFTVGGEAIRNLTMISGSSDYTNFIAKKHHRSDSTSAITVTAQDQLRQILSPSYSKMKKNSSQTGLSQTANSTHQSNFFRPSTTNKATILQNKDFLLEKNNKSAPKIRWLGSQEETNFVSKKKSDMYRLHLQNLLSINTIKTYGDENCEDKPNRKSYLNFKEELFRRDKPLIEEVDAKNTRMVHESLQPKRPISEINQSTKLSSQIKSGLEERLKSSTKKAIRKRLAYIFERGQITISRPTNSRPHSQEKSALHLFYHRTRDTRPSTTTLTPNRTEIDPKSSIGLKPHRTFSKPQKTNTLDHQNLKDRISIDEQIKPRIFKESRDKISKNMYKAENDNSFLVSKPQEHRYSVDWLDQLNHDQILKLSKKNIEKPFNPLSRKDSQIYDEDLQKTLDKTGKAIRGPPKFTARKNFKGVRIGLLAALKNLARLKIKLTELGENKIFSTVPFEKHDSRKFIDAVKSNNFMMVEILLNRNKYLVFDFDHYYQTALHWSVKNGYLEMTQYLIDHHSDIEARDIIGRTPLYLSIAHRQLEIMKFLLYSKCDPWSPMDYNYLKMCQGLPKYEYYLRKTRMMHIFMRLNPRKIRNRLWDKQRYLLTIEPNINLPEPEEPPN